MRVVDHHGGWARLASEACEQVRKAGGEMIVDVQHVGSTSVPDLPAKPILDLAAAVNALDAIPDLVRNLSALGYVYRGDAADQGGHLFVCEPEPDIRTIHLHVVTHDDAQWHNYLRFRDLLSADAALRRRYAALKRELCARFPNDRKSYTESKQDFIRGVLSTTARQSDPPCR